MVKVKPLQKIRTTSKNKILKMILPASNLIG